MMGRPAQDGRTDNVRERMLQTGGKPHAQRQQEPSQRTGRGVKRSEEEDGAGTGNVKRQRPYVLVTLAKSSCKIVSTFSESTEISTVSQ